MYNNLEAMWRQNEHVLKKKEVDAFSQEFDLRMKIGNTTALPPATTTTNQTQASSNQNSQNSLIRSQINSGNTAAVTNHQPNVNQNSLRSQNSSGNNGLQQDRGAPQHPISENLLRSNGNSLRESQRSQHHHHSSTMPRPASIQPTMHHSSRFVLFFSVFILIQCGRSMLLHNGMYQFQVRQGRILVYYLYYCRPF